MRFEKMLSPKILLRQKCFLSFFATTLLISLTTQSSLAFSINPLGPVGATQIWDPDESYTLANQSTGITRLSPTAVRSITRGGTIGFLGTLRRTFPTWNFNSASNDLTGSFEVTIYDAIGTSSSVGADFFLLYTPGAGDPTPGGNSLNWIQRVVNNHNNSNNIHGSNADIIDNNSRLSDPYYYASITSPFQERAFDDTPSRPDPDKDHNWLAELYLVEETAPQTVTIYNGIQWGWENRVQSVPEPLTIFGTGAALGFGALFKKQSRKQDKKEQNKKS